MTKDMTTGTPWKLMLQFAVPMSFGYLFQQMYSMVDSIIVGRYLGVEALAAVGSTSSLNFLIIGFISGICSGFSIPVSQYFGAKDEKKLQQSVANGAWVAAILGIFVTIITVLGTDWILTIMNTPENIFADAASYIRIIFMGIPATILYNLLSNYIRSLGDSKTPLLFLLISSVLNVVLDLLFVIGLNWSVAGAAWATVLAQLVSGLLCLVFIATKFPALHVSKENIPMKADFVWQHLSIGVPMGLQFTITAVGSTILQTAVNGLGSDYVAAMTAANKVQSLFRVVLDAICNTVAIYCGQNLGANRLDRVRQGMKEIMIASTPIAFLGGVVMILLGRPVSLLFLDSSETVILDLCMKFLFLSGIFYIILNALQIFRYAIQGLGFTVPAMLAGVAETVGRCFVSFVLVDYWGYTAICLAGPIAWAAATAMLIPIYFRLLQQLEWRA